MRRFLPLFFASFVVTLSAQDPVPQDPQLPPPAVAAQTEHERLEEQHIQMRAEHGESHASGGRPEYGPVVLGNPTTAAIALRVGLTSTSFTATGAVASEYSSLHHSVVELSHTDGGVKVIDRSTGKEITYMTVGSIARVTHDGTSFLFDQDGIHLGSFAGPIHFRPDSRDNVFRVENMRRVFSGTKVPLYRGAMEVGRGSTTAGLLGPPRFNLFNIIEVEDYVAGVVANESIASFSIEALKAQAIAARGYAIANIGNYIARGYPFDITDSTLSQVYRGVISEHVRAVQATRETHGLVASANGRIIGALYSSSFGGHSESSEWISFVANRVSSGAATSYLRGIYDGVEPGPVDYDTWWRTQPPSPLIHDDCTWTGNGFSRWKFTLPANIVRSRLLTQGRLVSGSRNGTISNVEITERTGASQRAAAIRVTYTNPAGVVELLGWETIRQTIGRTNTSAPRACGTNLIAASFVLNNPSVIDVLKNPDGSVNTLTVYGGGWGHNLGMSQYGAHGRGKLGQNFIQILQAYYTGVDIGSFPIDIGREPGSGPPTLRQEFVAPNALGTLEIRPTSELKGIRVHINGLHDLTFDATALATDVLRVDVSPYLVQGLNVIHYNPVGRWGAATVNVVVR